MSEHSSEYAALLLEKRNKRKLRQQEQSTIQQPIPEPIPEPVPEPTQEPVPEPTPEPISEPVPEPTPEPNTHFNTEDTMESNTQSNSHWRQNKTRNSSNNFNSNVNMRDFSARDFYNTASTATNTAKGVFAQLFDTWIAKIKTLSNPTINPGGNHPNNTPANPVNFNMNDWLLVGICVVGVALVFSDHSKEFDENGNLIRQTQQTQPLSIGARLSHDQTIRNQIEKQNMSTITFGERKILDHISSSASDNNKLVCELFLQTVKQTTGWWNDGTDRYDVKSQTAYKNACNRLLNTEYNY
jgi:hypothetical protein